MRSKATTPAYASIQILQLKVEKLEELLRCGAALRVSVLYAGACQKAHACQSHDCACRAHACYSIYFEAVGWLFDVVVPDMVLLLIQAEKLPHRIADGQTS